MKLNGVSKSLAYYFNLLTDKEDEQQVIEQVQSGVNFRGTNLWILICAIFIASLGLNVNSTAVIIGAMLISPLMGPIIGMGFSVGINDLALLRKSFKNYLVATGISVITATVYFFISPLSDAQSELLARTSPSLYDVLIAFFGGAAGVFAMTTRSKGQVIPGVAIATALMPPLCTAGYGLATAQWAYFFGAFYLFFINSVFIALATFLGVKLLRFTPLRTVQPESAKHARRVITAVVVLTMIPAIILTVSLVRKNVFERNLSHFVATELNYPGTEILKHELNDNDLLVVAVGREISQQQREDAQQRMAQYGLEKYKLTIIQGETSVSGNQWMTFLQQGQNRIDVAQRRTEELERQLRQYTDYDSLSHDLSREVPVYHPQVDHVGVALFEGTPVALVQLKSGSHLNKTDEQRLVQMLRLRCKTDSMMVVVR
ncbi:MAG: DUF389 domain-containing protein [Bacteroidales bacterium]|nr:DUF389 domain-containing protein [Bacteroidales bacterium]